MFLCILSYQFLLPYVCVHALYFILIDVVLLLGELVVKRMKYTCSTRSDVLLMLSFAINAQELKTVEFFRFAAFVFLCIFFGWQTTEAEPYAASKWRMLCLRVPKVSFVSHSWRILAHCLTWDPLKPIRIFLPFSVGLAQLPLQFGTEFDQNFHLFVLQQGPAVKWFRISAICQPGKYTCNGTGVQGLSLFSLLICWW